MKVAFINTADINDRKRFGGLLYFMTKALLNQSIALNYIGPLKDQFPILFRTKEILYHHLIGKSYNRYRDRILIKYFAKQISEKLSSLDVDLILSPQSLYSQPVAYLECQKPIVIWTDATFAGVIDFYPGFRNLCKETIRDGIENEKEALQRASLLIYSSHWAAQTAIEYYKIDKSKVRIVPYGPSIESSKKIDDIKGIIDTKSLDVCKLLFIGGDWYRKGGDIAMKIVEKLNKSGLKTELTLVGANPNINKQQSNYVNQIGYIDKFSDNGLREFLKLISESHFMILPTRADCTPVVFCEAFSHGLPCISSDVGGIKTIIKDGLNGKTFSKDANIEDYCTFIVDIFSDYSKYRDLSLSSYNDFETRLNWSVAVKRVKKYMLDLL